jgi:hypothetical protein
LPLANSTLNQLSSSAAATKVLIKGKEKRECLKEGRYQYIRMGIICYASDVIEYD